MSKPKKHKKKDRTMVTAAIVKVWTEGGHACMAVRVDEGGNTGQIEYIGRVPLPVLLALPAVNGDLSDLATNPTKRAAVRTVLAVAAKRERDATPLVADASQEMSGFTGSVTI